MIISDSETLKIEKTRFQNYRVCSKNSDSLIHLPSATLAIKASESLERFLGGRLQPVGFEWTHCICPLKGKSHDCVSYTDECRVPYGDHYRSFIDRKTRERVLTHHPYFGKSDTIAIITAASEAYAERFGLVVRVSEDSWYYPGKTLLVEYRIGKPQAVIDAGTF